MAMTWIMSGLLEVKQRYAAEIGSILRIAQFCLGLPAFIRGTTGILGTTGGPGPHSASALAVPS